ncbi:MAG: hypothetical protein IKA04_06285 [Alistipes sp.]|nr:hypothetical protein [Alistipes sp.]
MKKIFTLMLTLACAMFVSVSCSTDATTDGEGVTPPAEEVVGDAVTFDALDVLGYEAGTLNLAYTVNVERALDDQLVLGEPTAAWLKVATPEDAEDYVILTWDENNNSPNSPAREASFTATFGDNAPVTVTVKQNSTTEEMFVVEYGNLSPTMSLPIVHAVDMNMTWGYTTASVSQMEQWGTTDPQEYINMWVADQQANYGLNFWSWVFSPRFKGCSQNMDIYASRQEDEKCYLFVAGAKVESETVEGDWGPEVNVLGGEFTTVFHIYEMEFLPMPKLSVVGGENHSISFYGSHTLTVKVENPVADGMLNVDLNADWVEETVITKEDENTFKVNLVCAENPYALPRSLELYIEYGGMGDPYGMGMQMFVSYVSTNASLSQQKNDYAMVPKVSVALAENGNQFHQFIVNTTVDDESAYYVVGAANVGATNDLTRTVSTLISSSHSRPTYYQGNQENIVLKLNRSTMEWDGKDYYVYVCPVDAENHKLIAEPTFIEVKVDESKLPVLAWVETEDMKWNEAEQHYDLYVEPGTELTLSYTLTNPVEDGAVKAVISDYNQVFVQNATVVNAEAKTVTFTLDAYHANKNNHHAEISLKYAHATDNNWNWNILSEKIRVVHKAPAETPAK